MQRWREEYERQQAQFMRCIRSFGKMSETWNKLASLSIHSPTPRHVAHARKTAAMFSKLQYDAKQRFSAAGYKHRVDSMEFSDPPLLSDLIQSDRDALE